MSPSVTSETQFAPESWVCALLASPNLETASSPTRLYEAVAFARFVGHTSLGFVDASRSVQPQGIVHERQWRIATAPATARQVSGG